MRAGYRIVPYPLNAFLHVLTREEGRVDYLLYRDGAYGYRLLQFVRRGE